MDKTYYRIAVTRYDLGHIFRGTGVRPLEERFPAVEEILERRRPEMMPSRGDSIYVREEIDFERVGVTFSEGYVHTVVGTGFARRDLRWTGILQFRHIQDVRFRKVIRPEMSDDQVADAWWAGDASDEPDWEWVGRVAEVVAVDADPIVVRPNNGLLTMFDAP